MLSRLRDVFESWNYPDARDLVIAGSVAVLHH